RRISARLRGRAPESAVAVIRGWSTRLRHGDVTGAASFFALPSEFANGSGSAGSVLTIRTRSDAVMANASLPCGAELLSASRHGRFINALFRLTGRGGIGGSDCGGATGHTARTNFVIAH